jgi:hypothetical protein
MMVFFAGRWIVIIMMVLFFVPCSFFATLSCSFCSFFSRSPSWIACQLVLIKSQSFTSGTYCRFFRKIFQVSKKHTFVGSLYSHWMDRLGTTMILSLLVGDWAGKSTPSIMIWQVGFFFWKIRL